MRTKNKMSASVLLMLFVAASFVCSAGFDVKAQKEVYTPDYNIYHNISQISDTLSRLETTHKGYISLDHNFKSRAGHSQLLVKLANSSLDSSRKIKQIKILLVFGEHAREFFPIECMLYLLKNITAGLSDISDSNSRHYTQWIFDNFDIDLIAVANPDGRRYVEATKNFCWRGTTSGVDINRNFAWNYGGKGSSGDPADGEFRGDEAFSEPETLIFQKLSQTTSYDAFVSCHSGARHIYIPFADSISRTSRRSPPNKVDLIKLAAKMARGPYQRQFRYGLAYDLNGYTADGTSFDYMAGVQEIPLSLAIEMWQNDQHSGLSCFDEFNPKSENLLEMPQTKLHCETLINKKCRSQKEEEEIEMVHPLFVELFSFLHTWKSRQMLLNKSKKWKRLSLLRKKKESKSSKDSAPHQPSTWTYVFMLLCLVVVVVAAVKRICLVIKKKRVISLKTLSSTFTMLKHL